MAASILIVLGGLWAYSQYNQPSGLELALRGMVATHDACVAREDHVMAGIPQEDYQTIGQALSRRLNQSVLAADLSGDGWRFEGASICPVHGTDCAHLVFAKINGAAHMSVFSLPRQAAGDLPNQDLYTAEIDGHCIAAFVQGGQVYCMVGFCPNQRLTVPKVVALLQKHRNEMVAAVTALRFAAQDYELLQ